MPQSWTLHPQLANDTGLVGDLALSQVRVMHDANYPWLLLAPRHAGATHRSELSEAHAGEQLLSPALAEGPLAAERLPQRDAVRELIAAAIERPTATLLGRHVTGRADDRPRSRHPVFDQFGRGGALGLLRAVFGDLALLGLTLLTNIWVAWYEARRGRELSSDLLLADAAHTRADVFITIGVLIILARSLFMREKPRETHSEPPQGPNASGADNTAETF